MWIVDVDVDISKEETPWRGLWEWEKLVLVDDSQVWEMERHRSCQELVGA